MFWYGGGWAWWQAGLMWVAMIAFWVFLIWAVYALVAGRHLPPARSGDRRAGQEGQDGAAGDAEGEGHGACGVGGDRGPAASGTQCLR